MTLSKVFITLHILLHSFETVQGKINPISRHQLLLRFGFLALSATGQSIYHQKASH